MVWYVRTRAPVSCLSGDYGHVAIHLVSLRGTVGMSMR
jgi:hypothetical protein